MVKPVTVSFKRIQFKKLKAMINKAVKNVLNKLWSETFYFLHLVTDAVNNLVNKIYVTYATIHFNSS